MLKECFYRNNPQIGPDSPSILTITASNSPDSLYASDGKAMSYMEGISVPLTSRLSIGRRRSRRVTALASRSTNSEVCKESDSLLRLQRQPNFSAGGTFQDWSRTHGQQKMVDTAGNCQSTKSEQREGPRLDQVAETASYQCEQRPSAALACPRR